MKDTVIFAPLSRHPHTRSASFPISPVREQKIALLSSVKEALEVTRGIPLTVEASFRDVAVHDVFVFNAEAVCVDEVREDVLFG